MKIDKGFASLIYAKMNGFGLEIMIAVYIHDKKKHNVDIKYPLQESWF